MDSYYGSVFRNDADRELKLIIWTRGKPGFSFQYRETVITLCVAGNGVLNAHHADMNFPTGLKQISLQSHARIITLCQFILSTH
jgi:hypothetical protein